MVEKVQSKAVKKIAYTPQEIASIMEGKKLLVRVVAGARLD